MASSTPATVRPHWSSGRAYDCSDPERQVEVVGYVRSGGIETAPRSVAPAAAKPARRDGARPQPDFEGSSSRRWR